MVTKEVVLENAQKMADLLVKWMTAKEYGDHISETMLDSLLSAMSVQNGPPLAIYLLRTEKERLRLLEEIALVKSSTSQAMDRLVDLSKRLIAENEKLQKIVLDSTSYPVKQSEHSLAPLDRGLDRGNGRSRVSN